MLRWDYEGCATRARCDIQRAMEKSALERAFELARTGKYARADVMRKQLAAEGYDPNQIQGRALLAQLKNLGRTAQARSTATDSPGAVDGNGPDLNPD